MNKEWTCESIDAGVDPESGASITRIAAGGSLYCETPRASSDGKRIVIQRGDGFHVCDLENMSFKWFEKNCEIVTPGYKDQVHCWHRYEDTKAIYRVSLQTLERKLLCEVPDAPDPKSGATVSPNGDYLVYTSIRPPTCQVIRIDMRTGKWNVILEDPELVNNHNNFEPTCGRDILMQQNRGAVIDSEGNIVTRTAYPWATHFLVTSDGADRRPLASGEPWTFRCSGHSAWIGDTGRIVFATDWHHNEFGKGPDPGQDWTIDSRYPESTIFTVGPGESEATPYPTPDEKFFHVSVSKCGKYCTCNSTPTRKGPTSIVIVNLVTGKYRRLVTNVHCYTGSISPSSLPYMTADLKDVIYRAKVDPSIPGDSGWFVHAAEIPRGFFTSIE